MISKPMLEDFSSLGRDSELYHVLQGKQVYITGSTGQIGWYLVHFLSSLIKAGKLQCQVTGHVRSNEKLARKFPDNAELACRFIVGEDAAKALEENTYDFVIHCASKASPKHFAANPVDVMFPNGILTHALLEQIRKRNPACRFIYFSTTGVTGFIPDEQRPTKESDYGPLSCTELGNCYLESKRFGEMLSLAYFHQYGIPVVIVRPSITYGPGFDLDDGRSYADFVKSLLNKQAIKLTSDGSAVRNFLYISDFIRGLLLVMNKAASGSVLNISSPNPISILELATLLNRSIYPESLGPVAYQKAGPELTRVNFKSTDTSVDQLAALGWQQEISAIEGFRKTIRHYEEFTQ
jgi:UDP-glucuronate decarboxylase